MDDIDRYADELAGARVRLEAAKVHVRECAERYRGALEEHFKPQVKLLRDLFETRGIHMPVAFDDLLTQLAKHLKDDTSGDVP